MRKKLREWRREEKNRSRNTGEEEGNIGNYVRERKEENEKWERRAAGSKNKRGVGDCK